MDYVRGKHYDLNEWLTQVQKIVITVAEMRFCQETVDLKKSNSEVAYDVLGTCWRGNLLPPISILFYFRHASEPAFQMQNARKLLIQAQVRSRF